MTDDDIRAMLRAKAAEATVSADAWERIAVRLEAPARRPVARRLAIVGAAAAAVAGTVVVANLPPTNVAGPPVTTVAPSERADQVAIESAVQDWLSDRLPAGVDPGPPESVQIGDAARVVFRNGELATELFLQRLSGRPGWAVTAAASDLVPIFGPVLRDGLFTAEATAEATGTVEVFYRSDAGDEAADEPVQVDAQAQIPLRRQFPGARSVTAWVILRAEGGTVAISEVTAVHSTDPAAVAGSHVAVWPAVDSVGLADLQAQADAGERADLLDPVAVAGGFLSELLPRNEGATPFEIAEEFQQGDVNSGEVPYELGGQPGGVIQLRRAGEGGVWYVTGATSEVLELVTTRREEAHLVADIRSSADGDLRWTGATPIDVAAGQTVSIGRPDTPLGAYPVVVRLTEGTRTIALVAGLG